jgi:hypothetical protein
MQTMRTANNLLWIDCTAGAVVGLVVLLVQPRATLA